MASFVTGILGSAADGEAFTGQAHRLGMASHATIINDGVGPLTSRSGIIPGAGAPLNVSALGTPAMKVTVQPGTCAVQSTSVSGGVFTVTLTTATDLDITTANATNPRIDLVVAKVFADGTSATTCTVEVIAGTAAASPVRPSIASPPTNTHYFPLAQVRVEAAVTSIVAAKVTKISGDGQYTCAPGGALRYVTREWLGTRSSQDGVDSAGTAVAVADVVIPTAEALPGVYLVTVSANFKHTGTYGGTPAEVNFDIVTPAGTRTALFNVEQNRYLCFSGSEIFVLQAQAGSPVTVRCLVRNFYGALGLIGFPGPQPSSYVKVDRVTDL